MATTALQGVTLNGQPIYVANYAPIPDPYCYVCGRCTDHVCEHDDLEEAGLVSYEDGGIVKWSNSATLDNMAAWHLFDWLVGTFSNDPYWYYNNRYPTLTGNG